MKEIAGIGAVCLVIWGGFQLFKPVSWQAMYESSTNSIVKVGSKFDTKEACLDWIESERLNPRGRYNFECGSNCKPPTIPDGPYVCDDTAD